MPYLPYNDEEQLKKQNQQNGQVNISGGSTTVNQAAQSVAAPKPVANSGTWTNLNSYLDANKDNAENMGSTIASNIDKQGTTARTGITNTTQDFNTQVDKNTLNNLSSAKFDSDSIVNQARTNAWDKQLNEDQVKRFNEVSNAQYKGPNSLDASQYYQDTDKAINKAKEYQTNAQSDEGRFNLLQEMFAKPTYSQGQKSLDNLLIQGNDKAKSSIQTSANSLNDLNDLWSKASTDASALANQRSADINDVRQYAQNTLSTNRDARTQEVDKDLKYAQDHWYDQQNQYKDLLGAYKGGDLNLTQEQARTLGLYQSPTSTPDNVSGKIQNQQQPQLVSNIYNLLKNTDPNAYLDTAAYDANKVVSKDAYAQLAALDRLANQYNNASTSRFNQGIEQAGTSDLTNNFSGQRFGTAAVQAGKDFNQNADNTNLQGDFGFEHQGWNVTGHAGANVGQYLKDPSSITTSWDKSGGGRVGADFHNSAGTDAMQGARGNLYSQIQQWLEDQGKNNLVKIK